MLITVRTSTFHQSPYLFKDINLGEPFSKAIRFKKGIPDGLYKKTYF